MRGDGCVSEFGLLSTYFLIYRPRSGPGEAEDQTGTRCGYLAVTPAGTVRLHTLYLCSVHTRLSTATTRPSKLVTFPIIKDLQTFTQTIATHSSGLYCNDKSKICSAGICKSLLQDELPGDLRDKNNLSLKSSVMM